MRIISLFFTTLAFLFTNFSLLAFADPLVVNYSLNNQRFSFVGEQTAQGYRFNSASNNILNLATLNWPPYIGENLCNKGWVFQFAVAVLVSKGYQVNVSFYPWARSVKLVEQGKVDILFPEYFIEDSAPSDVITGKKRTELLVLSNKFPGGAVSLLKRKGEVFDYQNNLNKLKGKIIGVVRGYQNTPEFDTMMDNKQFDVINAVDELQLIRLLAAKRVELIIGDPKVFYYSVNHSTLSDHVKQTLLSSIEEVKPRLKYNNLYFAVSNKYKHWQKLINDINLALVKFEQSGETTRFTALTDRCN
jgi:polar amino acid transport system substrate-binding protein